MLVLRVLSGPQKGQIFQLKKGRNSIGRVDICDIKLTSPGVSKEHAEIQWIDSRVTVNDLNSSNGITVNGLRISTSALKVGDKLTIHDIVCDLVEAVEKKKMLPARSVPLNSIPPQVPVHGGSQYSMPPQFQNSQPMGHGTGQQLPPPQFQQSPQGLIEKISDFLDTNLMPSIISMTEVFEFKMILMGFVALFIISTTLLSMIPMVQLSRQSILTESKRRALTIAKTIATINQKALLTNQYTGLDVAAGEVEEGVTSAMIVQASDGGILAPASRAGEIPDQPFVHKARREGRQISFEVDSSIVGASYPIGTYDAATGEQAVRAYAIVLYDVSALSFDDGQVISLFMQTIIIATAVGVVIFFLMFRLIEFPIRELNRKLDGAIREKLETTNFEFSFPALSHLTSNINSLLSRYASGDGGAGATQFGSGTEQIELFNITTMMPMAGLVISNDELLIGINGPFLSIVNFDLQSCQGQNISAIPDRSFVEMLQSLVGLARSDYSQLHQNTISFSGRIFLLSCQSIGQATGSPYFIVTAIPTESGM